jgi:hypothetical protein
MWVGQWAGGQTDRKLVVPFTNGSYKRPLPIQLSWTGVTNVLYPSNFHEWGLQTSFAHPTFMNGGYERPSPIQLSWTGLQTSFTHPTFMNGGYERPLCIQNHLPSESDVMYMLQRYSQGQITFIFKNACNLNIKHAKKLHLQITQHQMLSIYHNRDNKAA